MKSKLEHNIQNQLENREIPVSENAWDRLQEMMDEPEVSVKKSSTRKLWFPLSIAASVVFLVGIYWDSNADVDTNVKEIQVVNLEIKNEIPQNLEEINSPEINQTKEIIQEEKIVLISNSQSKFQGSKSKIEPKDNLIQPILEVEMPMEISQKNEEIPTLVIQKEPKQELEQKPNFVDPEMLLYSIENNNAVKQSKSENRIVIKDFNK